MLIVSFIGFFFFRMNHSWPQPRVARSTEVNKTWTSWLLCHLSLRNSYAIYMIKGLKFTWLIDTVSQLFNFPEFFFDLSNIDHKFENYTFASTENQDPKGHSKRKQIYLHYMPSYFVYIQSYKNKNSPSNNLVKRADWPPLKIFLDPRLLVM